MSAQLIHVRGPLDDAPKPSNLEAERGLLGALLLDNDVIPQVIDTGLQPEDFSDRANEEIFRACLAIWEDGSPLELTILLDRLRTSGTLDIAGGYIAVAELEQFVFTTGAAPEWAETIAEKARLRRLMVEGARLIRAASSESVASHAIADTAQEHIARITSTAYDRDVIHISSVVDDAMGEIHSPPTEGVLLPAGLETVTEALSGGIDRTSYCVVAARPGVGKTAFALDWLKSCLEDGLPCYVINMEMRAKQITNRLLARMSGIPLGKIVKRQLDPHERFQLAPYANAIREWPMYNEETPYLTMESICRKCRLMVRRYGVRFVVIDYLQLIARPSRRSANEEVGEISRSLKSLALELEVPLLVLSQLSRESDKTGRPPRLSDLRDSGSIEQDADVVAFLYEGQIGADGKLIDVVDKHGSKRPVVFEVAKNRNGPAGRRKQLMFNGTTQRFGQHHSAPPSGEQREVF